MSVKKIVLIVKPSPTLGRSPLHGTGGGLFGWYRSGDYLLRLKNRMAAEGIDWRAELDTTESDIEKLIEQNVTLLVCVPGLRFQFYREGFDKNHIVYLTTMEYANGDVMPVMRKVREIIDKAGA
ncbi:nitrogen fixation protein NifS [Klebsiella sp. B345]|uniref:nitrogen fixation protein NifS n=1 Tax=Klebsiella sp. B345 TaxID=2755398 RepID=UPI003DA938BD